MTIINLLLIALLIALTGFFVAIEFAIVKVRPSRIDQLIAEGKKGAVSAKKVVNHLDEYLSACQLGITVTALGLGWLGEPTVEKIIHPLFSVLNINVSLSHILSFIIAFIAVTFLHVVVGELAPKTVAIHKAEEVALLFAAPIIGFTKVMRPFIWALNGSARLLVGIFGLKPESEQELAHSEEELRLLLSESYKKGEINQNELNYVNNIFEFDERVAKEIMVPRTEISTLSINDSIEVVLNKVRAENYSRYPVMEGDKDNIIGVLNVKVMVTAQLMNKKEGSLRPFIKPVIKAIETIPIHDLLVRMQKERTQMAILVDEYGGTSGLVTVEDIIEEIVGEVRDEFDTDEVAKIQKVKENHYLLDGKVLIEEVNSLLGTNIAGERIDTIGGWFLTQNFDVGIGTEAKFDGYLFKVREAVGHHILYLDVKKIVS
ncbi:CBS domain containing-hemolysin-like protein [Bacillus niacini]|uniref:CBS domain containing-hemolysin-like protein n=1 Tax=Neobacillus niacini TaxID=86668 RepID=A0A852TFJ1_9BACI|nr:hemolysin family protein [Neobacillus niacini]NYE05984.1 CBS domain containing-hemolysin-like protein [Neobacillus niacini]